MSSPHHPFPCPQSQFSWKPGSTAGRGGRKGWTFTHSNCILSSKQDVKSVVHIWASELENSPEPHSSDPSLHLKNCCQHVIALWLVIKAKQLNMGGPTRFQSLSKFPRLRSGMISSPCWTVSTCAMENLEVEACRNTGK